MIKATLSSDLPPASAPVNGAAPPRGEEDECLFIKGYVVPHELVPEQADPWSGVSLLDSITRS